LILIFCLFRLRQFPEPHEGTSTLICLGLIAFFFQLPFTHYLWDHLPELRIVGFPFRFQIFMAIALPLAVFALGPARKLRGFVFLLYGIFAVLPLWSYRVWVHAHGPFPPIREYAQSLEAGSVGMLEYTPAGTGAIALRDVEQQPRIGRVSSPMNGCSATVVSWLPESREITTSADAPCTYQLRLYYFAFWQVFVDGRPVAASSGATGLLQFHTPAGTHRIHVRFERPRMPLIAGTVVTGMAALGLAGLAYLDMRRRASVAAPVFA
jgi:hypothetical protein